MSSEKPAWPSLPLEAWNDTRDTLHMWTQIVGKTRLAVAPMVNHWWQVPLYVSTRGLTTSWMPYGAAGFSVDFDFIDHTLEVRRDDGRAWTLALAPRSVAEFYDAYHATASTRWTSMFRSGRCPWRSPMAFRSRVTKPIARTTQPRRTTSGVR